MVSVSSVFPVYCHVIGTVRREDFTVFDVWCEPCLCPYNNVRVVGLEGVMEGGSFVSNASEIYYEGAEGG